MNPLGKILTKASNGPQLVQNMVKANVPKLVALQPTSPPPPSAYIIQDNVTHSLPLQSLKLCHYHYGQEVLGPYGSKSSNYPQGSPSTLQAPNKESYPYLRHPKEKCTHP